jgi:hypothetical protein
MGLGSMHDISKLRFDALAAYCRSPEITLLAEEMRWLEFAGERLLGVLLLDTDDEFSVVLLARDLDERFRWLATTGYFASADDALVAAGEKAKALLPALDAERVQADERRRPVDFFLPVRDNERLARDFKRLASEEGFSPARGIIEPMMRWYEDVDGNFVEQFQTTGFDARIWELYLFAALTEAGFVLDRSYGAPDFVAKGLLGEILIEATTINPTVDADSEPVATPPTDTPKQAIAYLREYLPIRYAGPLTAKLAKRYWTLPQAVGKPLVLAIQDFHDEMSMTWSRSALPIYLYGYVHEPRREADGSLTIIPERVAVHRWGTKEVPSGFFMQPDAENIGAVIFNSSGTLSKFNRIGVIAGFGSQRVRLVRRGYAIDPDPEAAEPKEFTQAVDDAYVESWIEGMDVYHNPRATAPLDPAMLPNAAHHRLLPDGQLESVFPSWHPLASTTVVLVPPARS